MHVISYPMLTQEEKKRKTYQRSKVYDLIHDVWHLLPNNTFLSNSISSINYFVNIIN